MVPRHPYVERVVQKEIGNGRADDPALQATPLSRAMDFHRRHLHGRFQPSFDVEKHPRAIRVPLRTARISSAESM